MTKKRTFISFDYDHDINLKNLLVGQSRNDDSPFEIVGVSAELSIAQEEGIPYFLLNGHPDKYCRKPKAAKPSDKIYTWTWDNLKKLFNGQR